MMKIFWSILGATNTFSLIMGFYIEMPHLVIIAGACVVYCGYMLHQECTK